MEYEKDNNNMFYNYDEKPAEQTVEEANSGQYSKTYYDAGYRESMPEQNKGKRKRGFGKYIFFGVLLLLIGIALGVLVGYGVMTYTASKNVIEEDPVVIEEETEEEQIGLLKENEVVEELEEYSGSYESTASKNEMTVEEIAQKGLPSVVAITNKGITEVQSLWGNFTQESESSGSGVIIGQTETELLILTNYHVIEGNEQLTVVFSYEENKEAEDSEAHITTALVKDYDASRDIAVIAVAADQLSEETQNQIAVAAIGDSDALVLGQQVVAIGNALGYGQSVTTGIVSALKREVSGSGESIGNANLYIQTDAAINPGNSGGALFNMKGQLIGINSAKIASSSVEGMGYAIPITDILNDVESMMNRETREAVPEAERGYLGVAVVDVTADVSEAYGMPQGVYINAINEDSGAEAAGMKKGDIVTAVNGKTVRGVAELKEYLSYYRVGETVTLTLQRPSEDGYKESELEVVLSKGTETEAETETTPDTAPENNPSDGYENYYRINPFGNFFPFGF